MQISRVSEKSEIIESILKEALSEPRDLTPEEKKYLNDYFVDFTPPVGRSYAKIQIGYPPSKQLKTQLNKLLKKEFEDLAPKLRDSLTKSSVWIDIPVPDLKSSIKNRLMKEIDRLVREDKIRAIKQDRRTK